MRVVSADRKKFLAEPIVVNTPQDFNEGIETLKRIVENLTHSEKIEAIVGGIAGPLNAEKTMLVKSPNLSGWAGQDLKKALTDAFNVPVSIENDTAMVGLGEANFGAGRVLR